MDINWFIARDVTRNPQLIDQQRERGISLFNWTRLQCDVSSAFGSQEGRINLVRRLTACLSTDHHLSDLTASPWPATRYVVKRWTRWMRPSCKREIARRSPQSLVQSSKDSRSIRLVWKVDTVRCRPVGVVFRGAIFSCKKSIVGVDLLVRESL